MWCSFLERVEPAFGSFPPNWRWPRPQCPEGWQYTQCAACTSLQRRSKSRRHLSLSEDPRGGCAAAAGHDRNGPSATLDILEAQLLPLLKAQRQPTGARRRCRTFGSNPASPAWRRFRSAPSSHRCCWSAQSRWLCRSCRQGRCRERSNAKDHLPRRRFHRSAALRALRHRPRWPRRPGGCGRRSSARCWWSWCCWSCSWSMYWRWCWY